MWVIDLPIRDVDARLGLPRSSAAAGPNHPFIGVLVLLLRFTLKFFVRAK
jgi:hypothetical protein